MLGLSGHADMREVLDAADGGDEGAALALEVYLHRIRHYIGAYAAVLGGLDALVFTAGVGENSDVVRAGAVRGLEFLGIAIDPAANAARGDAARVISPADSLVAVLVVPTDEELEIARQTVGRVNAEPGRGTSGPG
jgi:acetate kinase